MKNLLQQYGTLKLKGACIIYFIASTEAFHAVRLTRGVSQSLPSPWDGRGSRGDITSLQVTESFTDHFHIDLPSSFQCSLKNAMTGLVTTIAVLGASVPPPTWAATDIAMDTPPPQMEEVQYDDFFNQMKRGNIEKVSFSNDGERLIAVDNNGNRLKMGAISNGPDLMSTLIKHKVDVSVIQPSGNLQRGGEDGEGGGGIVGWISSLIFPALLVGGLLFLVRRYNRRGIDEEDDWISKVMEGGGMDGGSSPMDFGRSRSKVEVNPNTGVTFKEVAGCDQAKFELEEVIDFLRNPTKYTKVGANIPRGVLLEGPPGTGKTMLAKAVAGEAGVPFLATSGSEFVEMFVGVGASRVRDLFRKAKENAPCIIFMDEIDAVGRQRGGGVMGGNDEREQTLNQILVEMDGFEGNQGVIVIAATNRLDILDNALTRPGRFDRKVSVDLPDYRGRVAVLQVHARNKPMASDVDISAIARLTPGFSGAELQNLLNEAAIFAVRNSRKVIKWVDIDSALDRLLVGLEKKDPKVSRNTKEIVAWHEGGHAVVGALIPDYDMVQKITIIPRSNGAGGLTFFAPNEQRLESGMYTKQYAEAQLAVALGGRVAEELVYGEMGTTVGASNDLQQVASLARKMVTQWGFSPKIGTKTVSDPQRRGIPSVEGKWGEATSEVVHEEVNRLVSNAYVMAKNILTNNFKLLTEVKDKLLEQETVSAEELSQLISELDVTMANYQIYDSNSKMDQLPFQELKTALPV